MAFMRRRSRTKSGHHQATVSLTPLIDTALTLLVIFMVATPMMHRGIKVELPQGNTDEVKNAQKQQDIVVYLDKKENLSLNGAAVTMTTLVSELKKLVKQNQQETVVVKADEGVPYGTVISVVDTIKHAGGISYVALATQRPRVS
jgi:biopolymer transport protein TolR